MSSFISKKNRGVRRNKDNTELGRHNGHQTRERGNSSDLLDSSSDEFLERSGDSLEGLLSGDDWNSSSFHSFERSSTTFSSSKGTGKTSTFREKRSPSSLASAFRKFEQQLKELEADLAKLRKENEPSNLLQHLSKPSDFAPLPSTSASSSSSSSSASFSLANISSNPYSSESRSSEKTFMEHSSASSDSSFSAASSDSSFSSDVLGHEDISSDDSVQLLSVESDIFSVSEQEQVENLEEFLEEEDYFDEYEENNSIEELRQRALTTDEIAVADEAIQQLVDLVEEEENGSAFEALKDIYARYYGEIKHLRKKPRPSEFPSLKELTNEVNRRKQAIRTNPRRSVVKVLVKLFDREPTVKSDILQKAEENERSIELKILDEVARHRSKKVKDLFEKLPSPSEKIHPSVIQKISNILEGLVKLVGRSEPFLAQRILTRFMRSLDKLIRLLCLLDSEDLETLLLLLENVVSYLEQEQRELLYGALFHVFSRTQARCHGENASILEEALGNI